MIRLCVLLLSLVCAGCKPQYADFFPYHDDGTAKPHVAFIPVINGCSSKLPWNVPQELTNDIRTRLMKDGDLFLVRNEDVKKQLTNLSENELSVSKDLMPFLFFQPAHFVVILELVDFKEVPYKRGAIKPLYVAHIDQDQAQVLVMKLRLRVIDIRGGEPKMIRQEIIESNHMMVKNALSESLKVRNSAAFASSPVGLAQARLARDVTQKIERIANF
ncbi:MAG: hypothetical protein JWO53_21 [Chlamydiia bacterium]|nr:hypothetical protein [Chlamydiia bacterium]